MSVVVHIHQYLELCISAFDSYTARSRGLRIYYPDKITISFCFLFSVVVVLMSFRIDIATYQGHWKLSSSYHVGLENTEYLRYKRNNTLYVFMQGCYVFTTICQFYCIFYGSYRNYVNYHFINSNILSDTRRQLLLMNLSKYSDW